MTNTNQFTLMDTDPATTSQITVGQQVAFRGRTATVADVRTEADGYAETWYRVQFDEGGSGIFRASELSIAPTPHPLSWWCKCEICVTARKTLGRAWK